MPICHLRPHVTGIFTIPGRRGNASTWHTAHPGSHWLQEAEARMLCSIRMYRMTLHVHSGTHSQTQREWTDRRGDRYAQLLEPKLGRGCRSAVRHEDRRAVQLQVPSFPPIPPPPSGDGDTRSRWVSYHALLQCLGRLASLQSYLHKLEPRV